MRIPLLRLPETRYTCGLSVTVALHASNIGFWLGITRHCTQAHAEYASLLSLGLHCKRPLNFDPVKDTRYPLKGYGYYSYTRV